MRNAARFAILSAFVAIAACGGDSTGPSDHSPKTIGVVGGNNQQGVVGTAVAVAPSVVVKDKSGSVVEGAVVTFTVTAGGGSITGGSATTNAAGVAQVGSWTLGTATGTNTLSASVASLTPVSINATAVAGPAANLVFTTAPSSTASNGVALAQQPVIQLKDQFGNNATQAGVSVVAAIATGGGTLGGVTTVPSNASGVVTFTNLSIGGTVGARTLSFTATGLPALSSGSITLTAGPAASVTANSTTTLNGTAGAAVTPLPSVLVRDASNNPVAGATVTFAVATGGGSLTGATPVTDAAGIATVGSWTLGGTAGAQSLTATVGALTPITFSATAAPAAGSRLTLSTQPSATSASGATLAQQPVLRIEDGFGNLVTTASNPVTATLQGAGAALGGTVTVAAVNGIVTFTDLAITGTVGNYTLAFGGAGLTGTTSTAIALGAGAAANIAVNAGDNQTAPVGTAVQVAPSVRVTDASGNAVSGTSVTFAVATGGGSLTGGTTTTNASGIATVGSWTLGNAIGANTLTATSAGLAGSPVTFTATGTPGAGSLLSITTQPSANANNGVALAQQPVIQLRDALNNPVSLPGVVVTASVASGGGSVSGGTTATTDVNGTATFSGLVLNGLVGTKTLSFSATGVTGVTSASITLAAGAAVKLAVVTNVGSTLVNGALFSPQPVVRLQDAGGNNVSTAGVQVTASLIGSGAVLGGTLNQNTGAAGSATYSTLRLTGTVGSYSLAFNSAGLTGVTMGPISLLTGPAATLALDAGDGQTAPAGTAVSVAPSVLITDQSGNPVSGTSVTFAVATGGGSVVGGAATSNASGIAAVTSWTLGSTVGSNTLTATSAGLAGSPLTFTATGVAGAASQLVFTTPPSSSASNGVALAQQPVVQLQDAFGNDVSQAGVVVTASIASVGDSVTGGTTATTNASGTATFSGLILNGLVGNKTITFSAPSVTPLNSSPIALAAGAAAKVVMVTQPSASAVNGAVFGTQPAVRITDAGGNFKLQAGISVTVAIASGGGVLGGVATVNTDGTGTATFSGLSILGLAGNRTLSFSSAGLTSATSNLINITAGAATTLAVNAGDAQTAAAGSAVSIAPSVIVTDQSGNPVSGTSVTFAVATGGGSVLGGAATSNASGIAAVTSWTLGTTAGSNSLTATSAGLTGSPLTFTATGTPAAASQLVFTTPPSSSASNGVPLAQQPVVQLQDQFGNNVSQAGVVITASVASVGDSVTGGTTATTNAGGTATFSGLILNGLVGNKTLTFTAPSITPLNSGSIALAAGAAAKVVMVTQPSASAVNGAAFGTQPVVRITDAGGNFKLQAGVPVTVSIATGGGALGGTATVNTDASGVVTYAGLSITGIAGNHTLSFASAGLASATSNTIVLTASAATTVAISAGDGQSAAAGSAVSVAPAVLVTDQSGNPVSGTAVTFAVATGGGSVVGGSATSNASGIAAVTSWTLGTTAGSNTLTATSGGLTGSPLTFTATGTAGAASQLTITTQPSATASNGIVLAQQPVLQLRDQFGNAVSQNGVVVTASVASGGGSVSGGITATTNASGVATFSGLIVNGLVGTKTLSFSANGVTSATSGNIALAAGAAAQVVMSTQPSATAINGGVFTTQPAVRITDAGGNFVLTAGTPVTVAIAAGGGSLGGTATVNTDGTGTATFAGLSITGVAGNRTLSFSSGGLTPATSSTIAITAGPATTIALSSGDGQSATVGTAVVSSPTVLVTDQSGNPVSGVAVNFAVATGGGSIAGGAASTNAGGLAVAGAWTLGTTAGSNTVTATSIGLNGSPVTFTATGTPAAANQLSITTQPSSSASNGVVLAQQPVLQLKDQFGNNVSQAGVVVTASVASGGGSVSGGITATTSASGVATFSGLVLNGLVGTKTLGFSASGLSSATSGSITLSAGAAAQVVIATQPSATAVNGVAFATQPVARITDAGGNFVLQAGINVTAAIATGGGSLGGVATVATDASGIATFSGLSITGTAGNHTLSFASAGLSTATSTTVATTAGAAATIAISAGDAQSAVAGTAVAIAPSVLVTDQSNNPVSGTSVTFAVATGGGSVVGGAATSNASGIAAVTSWTLGSSVGSNSLTATSAGLTGSPLTFTATATAAPASQLVISTQPSASGTVGVALATQPVIQLQDQFGNPVSQAGIVVTASIFSGGGSVAGSTTATTSAGGTATFSGLIVNGTAGTSQVLRFTSGSLTAVNSTAITLSAGAASQITITTQPSSTVANGAVLATQPVVQLKDLSGNNAATAGVNIVASLTGTPGGVTLGGTTTIATNASGTATFTNLSLTGLAGSYTITFAKSGLTSAVSGSISLTAGAPANVTANSTLSQSGRVGAVVTTLPQVRVVDASGNPVSGATVTFAVTTGGGSVTGASPTTDALGLATVGGWTLGKTVTTNTVTATVGALPVVSFTATPTFVVSRVAGGGGFTCAVTVDGVPYCWGDNSSGALGDNSTSPHGTPAAVSGSNAFVSIAAGLGHTCGITSGGVASCWGANTNGQLGVNSTSQKLIPTLVNGGLTFTAIDLGTDHSCGITSGGAVQCWGANGSGQLGLGNNTQKLVPTQVAASGYLQVTSGVFYSCGTRTTGAGNCWGINGFGQLGDSTKGTRTSPTLVKGSLIFVEIVSSQTHSCGRTSAGTVWCWGLNANGRLGQDSLTVTESLVPKQILGLSNVSQLVSGQAHTCARNASNAVLCWGLGDAGQLGTGDFNNRQTPTAVSLPGGVSGFVSIAAGASHTCGVTSTGSLYCWGDNFNGQIGDGSGLDQNVPTLVVNP